MEFRDRVAAAMAAKDMNQAALCRATGMGSSKVSQILTGKTKDPRIGAVLAIADALDVSIDYLAGLTDEMNPRGNKEEKEVIDSYRASKPEVKKLVVLAMKNSQE